MPSAGPHAPGAEQSSFGGTGGTGVGAGGHWRISQWHVVPFVRMQRPVLPPSEPSGQMRVGISSAGPHWLVLQTERSADVVSVASSLDPSSGAVEHAGITRKRTRLARVEVRAFMGGPSVYPGDGRTSPP